MNWNDLTSRKFSSTTTGTKDSDGFWKVIIEMLELVELNHETLEPRTISAMGIDKDFNTAFEVATQALFNKFTDETKGTGTLYLELAVEANNDNSQDNQITEPQSASY